jgi:hypothetical protein
MDARIDNMFREVTTGQIVDLSRSDYPCCMQSFDQRADERLVLDQSDDHTHYGYAMEPLSIISNSGNHYISAGAYWCVPGAITIKGGRGILITRKHYLGLFSIGGPVEAEGRLRYIDGCSDSLIVGPPVIGDPCLNLLHFPKQIRQTMHTHPTVRMGCVAGGKGRCVTPHGEIELLEGMAWYLPPEGQHCFYTDDETMDIIAWHPDSDTGPSHDDHPMLNRTYVDGGSVRYRDDIRTHADGSPTLAVAAEDGEGAAYGPRCSECGSVDVHPNREGQTATCVACGAETTGPD